MSEGRGLILFHVPNPMRVRSGEMGSTDEDGNNGLFFLPPINMDRAFVIIASDGMGWEHCSVHMRDRKWFNSTARSKKPPRMWVPGWAELCHVKSVFWEPEDVVVQFHPKASEYVSIHDYVLHLWRPLGVSLPTPPIALIGPVTGERH